MVQKTVQIGEWVPDAYSSAEGVLKDVVNLIPSIDGYKGVMSFKGVTEPLPDWSDEARPLGAATFVRSDRSVVTVVGTQKNLYIRETLGAWRLVSKEENAYTSADSRWKFELFGDLLIATNYADPVQCMNLSTDTQFHDLSSTAPRARDLAIVNEFLVLINTVDEYDGVRPQRIWWSPIGDPQGEWVPNQTTMCDYQDVFAGSYITGVVGGEDALVMMRDALVRMSFVGSPVVFQFQTLTTDYGNLGYDTYASIEGTVFFLSETGFKQYEGGVVKPIGMGKVDNFAWNDTMGLVLSEAIAGIDLRNNCVWWAYRSKKAIETEYEGLTDKALVYHYPSGKWGKVHQVLASFCYVNTKGYSLDELDEVSKNVDELPFSLDSEAWRGGVPVLAGFSKDGEFGYFYGDFYEGQLITGHFPLNEAHSRVFIRRVRPRVDGTDTTIKVAMSGIQDEQDTAIYTSLVGKTRVGDFPFRVSGRFHSIKMTIAGTFNRIMGFLLDFDDAGEF